MRALRLQDREQDSYNKPLTHQAPGVEQLLQVRQDVHAEVGHEEALQDLRADQGLQAIADEVPVRQVRVQVQGQPGFVETRCCQALAQGPQRE